MKKKISHSKIIDSICKERETDSTSDLFYLEIESDLAVLLARCRVMQGKKVKDSQKWEEMEKELLRINKYLFKMFLKAKRSDLKQQNNVVDIITLLQENKRLKTANFNLKKEIEKYELRCGILL